MLFIANEMRNNIQHGIDQNRCCIFRVRILFLYTYPSFIVSFGREPPSAHRLYLHFTIALKNSSFSFIILQTPDLMIVDENLWISNESCVFIFVLFIFTVLPLCKMGKTPEFIHKFRCAWYTGWMHSILIIVTWHCNLRYSWSEKSLNDKSHLRCSDMGCLGIKRKNGLHCLARRFFVFVWNFLLSSSKCLLCDTLWRGTIRWVYGRGREELLHCGILKLLVTHVKCRSLQKIRHENLMNIWIFFFLCYVRPIFAQFFGKKNQKLEKNKKKKR